MVEGKNRISVNNTVHSREHGPDLHPIPRTPWRSGPLFLKSLWRSVDAGSLAYCDSFRLSLRKHEYSENTRWKHEGFDLRGINSTDNGVVARQCTADILVDLLAKRIRSALILGRIELGSSASSKSSCCWISADSLSVFCAIARHKRSPRREEGLRCYRDILARGTQKHVTERHCLNAASRRLGPSKSWKPASSWSTVAARSSRTFISRKSRTRTGV
jgi:hypothetical protein